MGGGGGTKVGGGEWSSCVEQLRMCVFNPKKNDGGEGRSRWAFNCILFKLAAVKMH